MIHRYTEGPLPRHQSRYATDVRGIRPSLDKGDVFMAQGGSLFRKTEYNLYDYEAEEAHGNSNT